MNTESTPAITPGTRFSIEELRAVETPPAASPVVSPGIGSASPPPPAPIASVETSQTFTDLILSLNKDVALLLIAAGCFFVGVILACITPGKDGTFRRETCVSAPFTFLLTAGLWYPLLHGNLVVTQIAPIDSILKFFIDGGMSGQMFVFGLVMVLGYHSAAVFDFINGVFRWILSLLKSKTPPSNPPAAPT